MCGLERTIDDGAPVGIPQPGRQILQQPTAVSGMMQLLREIALVDI
jgi:hypothetical protein